MQIDWLTVIAQVVNFLILVWLLKRFLYEPVTNAMDQREQRITERLQNAVLREQAARDAVKDYDCKIQALEKDRGALIDKASQAAETKRLQLLDEARSEVAEKRAHWQRQVTQEKQDFLSALKHQAAESIQTIARRALADLADAELEEQIIRSFVKRLKSLDEESRSAMVATAESVRIVTSSPLESSIRDRLTGAIQANFCEDIEVVYSESPDLLCGIELSVSGHRLSWTLADYLQDLEQRMQEQLGTIGGTGE